LLFLDKMEAFIVLDLIIETFQYAAICVVLSIG
jgi:hypothetical protein